MAGEGRPDWEAFGREIMRAWPEGGIGGFELQEIAEKHGLIREVPGGFDPERHLDDLGIAEKGDPWFERAYVAAPADRPETEGRDG